MAHQSPTVVRRGVKCLERMRVKLSRDEPAVFTQNASQVCHASWRQLKHIFSSNVLRDETPHNLLATGVFG
jgi:hypothetical protein